MKIINCELFGMPTLNDMLETGMFAWRYDFESGNVADIWRWTSYEHDRSNGRTIAENLARNGDELSVSVLFEGSLYRVLHDLTVMTEE
jgi:hypothetical protein